MRYWCETVIMHTDLLGMREIAVSRFMCQLVTGKLLSSYMSPSSHTLKDRRRIFEYAYIGNKTRQGEPSWRQPAGCLVLIKMETNSRSYVDQPAFSGEAFLLNKMIVLIKINASACPARYTITCTYMYVYVWLMLN